MFRNAAHIALPKYEARKKSLLLERPFGFFCFIFSVNVFLITRSTDVPKPRNSLTHDIELQPYTEVVGTLTIRERNYTTLGAETLLLSMSITMI